MSSENTVVFGGDGMERYNLNQWLVKIGDKEQAIFTPLGCVREDCVEAVAHA